ncbi:MAG: hypothetical protein AAFY44_17820, partial [Pseudomonadota bacterium]
MADEKDTRRFSSVIVDGPEQAPSRAMLRAVGFENGDFALPQIGVASTWSARSSMCMLQGVTLLHVDATPICGR